jgi:hypothetical protein
MDVTYHEAISTQYQMALKGDTGIISLKHSEILRYGVSYRAPILINENDKYIYIVVAWHWKDNGERDINKLKVKFKRIRSGLPYRTY